MNTSLREPPSKIELPAPPARVLEAGPAPHPWRRFARHYLEMAIVMIVGMFAAASVFMIILNLVVQGNVTWEQALLDYPVPVLIAVAVGMSAPMVPWMLHRAHNRKTAYEMGAVMAILVIPFVCLALFDVVKGSQCALYCGVGFIAMFALMLYRRSEYSPEDVAVG